MPNLANYNEFAGRHWETGSIRNVYAYLRVKAPHTGQPYTEAMFMGISGGAVMSYFSFAYEGYDPHVAIMTRNIFNPMDTIFERLGVTQEIRQTSRPDKGLLNLIDTLEDGVPAIVWADMFSLPYNAQPYDEKNWAMFPIVVYGYDEAEDTVWIADRAKVPLTVTPAELATARGRIKKDKFRILILDHPNPDKLPAAVQKGIWDCIKLYTETPPKGSKNNFGLAAFRWWADLLTKPKQRLSWARVFPQGRKMYTGLTSTLFHAAIFGKDGNAERNLYADFLDEASLVLGKPALKEATAVFRRSGQAWDAFSAALLPDEVLPFQETRELMLRQHHLFLEQGNAALPEIQQINSRLEALKESISTHFPFNETEMAALCENLRTHLLAMHDIEYEAVTILQEAMA